MNTSRIVGGLTVLVVLLAGCSSADEGGAKDPTSNPSGSSGSSGKTPKPAGDPETQQSTDATEDVGCVPEGTKGNSIGVGAFCASASDCKEGTFCPVGQAPEGSVFCTAFCATDADCGENATCFQEARGKGCVPNACLQ